MKHIIGIGNALTDVLINLKNDQVLNQFGLRKGSMSLVDTALQQQIESTLTSLPHTRSLGGSALNTIRALSSLGVPTGFIGKVGRDTTGDFFEQTLHDFGITSCIFRGDNPSGQCLCMVSADGERTMCTYLGASVEMHGEDISAEVFKGYDCLYIEGYLVQDHTLIAHAAHLAKEHGLKIALDLASFNVVEENLEFLRNLVNDYVDILFANEQEAAVFTGETNPLEALERIGSKCSLGVVKVGKQGSYIKHRGQVYHVGIMAAARRVDTTGAGDFYAAGFLAGLTENFSMVQCGTLGAIVAGKVIEVVGTTFPEPVWQEIRELTEEVKKENYLF